tara:strand:+ start:981 stop:2021 length:1041 start_codon:yes stop_codon:yes gene_type:complete
VIDRRSEYLKRKSTPTPFNQGPEMQNYNRMMDLQSKASAFGGNDPRIQELKDARRQYNRQDKYTIGQRQGMAPLDVQKQFANQSEALRTSAPGAYKTMYPITSAAVDYIGGGGLLGMAARAGGNFLSNISNFGKNMAEKKGITGAADADEADMQNYAAQTFGMGAPIDRHPGTMVDGIEYNLSGPANTSTSEVIYSPHGPTYYDRAEVLDFDEDPNQPYVAPDDYVEEDFGDFADRFMPIERDSNREAGIMSQYSTNFIGPRDDPNRRPNMFDVAGPGINRGLIPYPEYGPGIVYQEGSGRGDLPRYGYDYGAERKGRADEYKLQQLLDFINNQKIQQEPSRINLR